MPFAKFHSAMAHSEFQLTERRPSVVGSFGSPNDLGICSAEDARIACDLAEIRLDLLEADGSAEESANWRHLQGIPLLFTARRREEGGALDLSASRRIGLLQSAMPDAALIDIEVASIPEMTDFLSRLEVPWIASFHDFEKLPETRVLEDAAKRAKDAGAAAFKTAAKLHSPADIARLADFQLANHGILVATRGMGPLAPVSRLLCAQCGSVLNYGFLGETPTAPGQWDAASLKQAIARLVPYRI